MGKVVSSDAFAQELGLMLSRYGSAVAKEVDKELRKTAKEISDEVKSNAQSAGFNIGETGTKYVKGWSVTKNEGKWVVYNKTIPSLAHLLENGHEIVVHGIATGKRTRAFKHIEPAQILLDKKIDDLENKLENIEP